MTLQGAVRYRPCLELLPEQQIGPTRFLPTAAVFPETQGVVGYSDIDPRFGVAYDLFGNGKTALKVNVGRYLEAAVGGNGNYSALLPSGRVTTSVTRTWTDANRDFTPQCDLINPLANGECAQISDLNFGKTINTLSYDPNIMQGCTTGRATESSARRFSTRSCRAFRCRRGTRDGGSSTSRSPTTGRSRQAITRRSASRRRSIPGCQGAVAMWYLACTTSCSRWPASSTTTVPFRGHHAGLQRFRSGRVGAHEGPAVSDREQHGPAGDGLLLRAIGAPRTDRRVFDRQRSARNTARRIPIVITRRESIRGSRPSAPTQFQRSTCCSAAR